MLARYELDHSETEMCQPSSGKVSRFAECHHSVAFLYLIRGVNIVSTTRLEQTEISSPPFPGNDFVNPAEAAGDTRLAAWEFPKKTRLTDTGVYLAIKYLGRGDRNRRHPYDFIHIGHIFRGRVPSGKPVILWAHGLAWIAVWRKSHILCLEKLAHRAGWLLESGLEEKQPSGDADFLAGIVLASTDIFPLEAGAFEVELTKHQNPENPLSTRRGRHRG
ncbi:hypothetical protein N7450_001838 [Penicillium hetheringtonii]|nr:hypothetical protein N7450_001838 [Penicillium hetheringtonii]